jgi:hypothetical protein
MPLSTIFHLSWRSVLLVEESGVGYTEKTTNLLQVTDNLYHIMLYQVDLAMNGDKSRVKMLPWRSGGTKDHFRQVKVPGTALYCKAWSCCLFNIIQLSKVDIKLLTILILFTPPFIDYLFHWVKWWYFFYSEIWVFHRCLCNIAILFYIRKWTS